MEFRTNTCKLYLVILQVLEWTTLFSQAEFQHILLPQGAVNSIQYNADGAFNGASAAFIIDSTIAIGTNPGNYKAGEGQTKLFTRSIASRNFICGQGPYSEFKAGMFLGDKNFGIWYPLGNGATTVNTISFQSSITGTSTGANVAAGSVYNQRKRLDFYNTAGGTNQSSFCRNTDKVLYLSSGSKMGGFFCVFSFGIFDQTLYLDSTRLFVGLDDGVPSSTNNPSTNTNIIGVGFDDMDTAMYIMHNDASGNATKVLLGPDFTYRSANRDWFKFYLYNPQGGSVTYWHIINEYTGTEEYGTITTDLPANTVLLQQYIWRNTGLISYRNTFTSAGLMYYETEY